MIGRTNSGTPNVRGNIGRLHLNSRAGTALTSGERSRRGATRARYSAKRGPGATNGAAGLAHGTGAAQRSLSSAKGGLDAAQDDHDVQQGAESALAGGSRAAAKRTAKTAHRSTTSTARKAGSAATRGRAGLARGGSASRKGGLMAAKKRAAKRRAVKVAQKRAKKAAGAAGLPTSPAGALKGGIKGAKGAARAAQLALQAARAAVALVRTAIMLIGSVVTSTPVLITIAVVILVLALIVALLAIIPGIGEEAQKSENAFCTTNGAAVSANVSNLPFSVAGYGPDQLRNAAVIMKVAQDSGLDRRAQLIGLITAIQESDLGRDPTSKVPNPDGDAGLFQQRTHSRWYGSLEMVNNPVYSATAFYNGVTAKAAGDWGSVGGGAGFGHIPGLKDIPNWQSMPLTEAASSVQKPDEDLRGEYAKHEQTANELINALGGTNVELGASGAIAGCGGVGGVATGTVKAVIDYAMSWQGKGLVYNLGSGTLDGPTNNAMDCSSFVGAAWKQGAGITFGRSAQDQWNNLAAYRVQPSELQPGDLLFEAAGRRGPVGDPNSVSHVLMYIGNGQTVEWGFSSNGFRIGSVEGRINAPAFVGAARPPAPQEAAK